VLDAERQRHEAKLDQVGPGRYAGRIAAPTGSVVAKPVGSLGGRPLDGDWVVLARPYPEELAKTGSDEAWLDELVRAGGGRRVEFAGPQAGGLTELTLADAKPATRAVPLAGLLGLAALALLLVDVAAKRSRFGGAG
jgi:hypothetical protein